MGIFDGILIASDWDGTLFYKKSMPDKTREAINYFMSEGGRFSITSGRGPEYLVEQSCFIKPNTYCICYGGSLVTKVESGEILHRGGVDESAFNIIDALLRAGANLEKINLYFEGEIRHYTPEEYNAGGRSEGVAAHIYKITFNCPDDEEELKRLFDSIDTAGNVIASSFPSYYEIMKAEYTKGVSAKLLKKRLGARLLVGMGDYENDIPLFGECDVTFAVANAVDSLKSIATYVTKAPVWESAAAEVVETLEKLIREGKL